MSYKYLDHGADIGIHAEGRSIEELFAEAAKGLFSLMVDLNQIKPISMDSIQIKGETFSEDLLYEWLKELLTASDLKRSVYKEFDVNITQKRNKLSLNSQLYGQKINPDKHTLGSEVKAITYQGLEVERKAGKWICQYVVDV